MIMEDGKPHDLLSASWIWEKANGFWVQSSETQKHWRVSPSSRTGEDALPAPGQAERGETQVLGGRWGPPPTGGEWPALLSPISSGDILIDTPRNVTKNLAALWPRQVGT